MDAPWLILETSGRTGLVGVAVGNTVKASRSLDSAKRHNRDLIPTCSELLSEFGFTARQLAGVLVGVGPGSYTGIRVGLTAAKGFALATGCEFIAVPTFETIASQAPADWPGVEVISDALQGTIYRQQFGARQDNGIRLPAGELQIVSLVEWLPTVGAEMGITGPGAEQFRAQLGDRLLAVTADCHPQIETTLRVGRLKSPLSREGWFAVEPLYLRGSSAEEKAKKQ